MAQADSKPTPSRRQAMVLTAAIAALPAAVPALANNPDAQLLALNVELERRWKVAWDLYGPVEDALDEAEEELQERMGGKSGRIRMRMSDADRQECWRISNEIRDRRGIEALNTACRAAWEALEDVQGRIFDIPPSTLPGAAVWARAIATGFHDWWWTENDDRDEKQLCRLIETIVTAGGLQMPVDLIEVMTS
jgi:hypothetical protein